MLLVGRRERLGSLPPREIFSPHVPHTAFVSSTDASCKSSIQNSSGLSLPCHRRRQCHVVVIKLNAHQLELSSIGKRNVTDTVPIHEYRHRYRYWYPCTTNPEDIVRLFQEISLFWGKTLACAVCNSAIILYSSIRWFYYYYCLSMIR